ncbi:hypothetical protein X801_08008, partial [Opisthorchis viverrini]
MSKHDSSAAGAAGHTLDELRSALHIPEQLKAHDNGSMLAYPKDTEAKKIRINQWVSEQTKSKIQELIPDGALSEKSWLFIANAIYFKGAWKTKFNEDKTESSLFHGLDGSETQVETMTKDAWIRHGILSDLDAKSIKLPFRDDSQVKFLPA